LTALRFAQRKRVFGELRDAKKVGTRGHKNEKKQECIHFQRNPEGPNTSRENKNKMLHDGTHKQ
jgi:hypothetical protein